MAQNCLCCTSCLFKIFAEYCQVTSTFGKVIAEMKMVYFCGSQCMFISSLNNYAIYTTELYKQMPYYGTVCNQDYCKVH